MDDLLERESELAALMAAVRSARDGRGAVVVIRGEAGIGKTSLLRALRGRAQLPMHIGRGEPLSVPEPLGPIRELAVAAGAGGLPDLTTGDRRGLARALQAALTSSGPAIAAIEDAHWADPASLDVVRVLARRAEDVPLVLIVTLRDDELAAHPALALLIGDLATEPGVVRLSLARLSAAAVRALAGARGDIEADDVLALTAGNPFLVAEMLAARGTFPVSVRDATLARVARLGPQARGVVDAAAVVGQRVAPALLGELVSDPADAVEEALATGVLTDDGTTLGFRHELTRQAIERALSAPRRAALHGRVAQALVATGTPDHARIAHHAEAAGQDELAARHAERAAAAAERVGALREASLQLRRALSLAGGLRDDARTDLLIRYARSLNFAGRDLEQARAAADEAVALADRSGDRRAGGRARTVLSATLWSLDRLEPARAAAAEAVDRLEGTGDLAELARARAAVLRIESIAFDPARAIADAPASLAAAHAAQLPEARVDTLISLALAHGHRGAPQAGALLEQARDEARVHGTAIQIIRAHVNGVAVAGDARDHARADRITEAALAQFADFETAIPRQYLMVLHARTLMDRGRYGDALAEVAQGRGDWHGGLVVADTVEALIEARRGQAGAGEALQAALTRLDGIPPGWRHLFLRAALAEVAWLSGEPARGAAHARAGLAAPYATQLIRPAADALLWSARCGAVLDWPGDAPELPGPVRLELAGEWRAAARAWDALDAPYEAALAALGGDQRAAREALATLRRLGALGGARAFAREREARGAGALRGPRRSTLAHPAGLTRREQQVLEAMAGGATNTQIATALHLSPRTVAHHVSSVLAKLGTPTRTAAVQAAHGAGLLGPQDGPLRT